MLQKAQRNIISSLRSNFVHCLNHSNQFNSHCPRPSKCPSSSRQFASPNRPQQTQFDAPSHLALSCLQSQTPSRRTTKKSTNTPRISATQQMRTRKCAGRASSPGSWLGIPSARSWWFIWPLRSTLVPKARKSRIKIGRSINRYLCTHDKISLICLKKTKNPRSKKHYINSRPWNPRVQNSSPPSKL
jgi:hypothetical protein